MAGLIDFFAPRGLLDFIVPRTMLEFDPSPVLASYARTGDPLQDVIAGRARPGHAGTSLLTAYRDSDGGAVSTERAIADRQLARQSDDFAQPSGMDDETFRQLSRPIPMAPGSVPGFRQDSATAAEPTPGHLSPPVSTAPATREGASFGERFGALQEPQWPNLDSWLRPPPMRRDWVQDLGRALRRNPAPSSWVPPWLPPTAPTPQQYLVPPPHAPRPALSESKEFMLADDLPNDWLNPMDAEVSTADQIIDALRHQRGIAPADTDQAVRTIHGEAKGETPRERQAVASVILNRAANTGKTLTEIVHEKRQFEPWGRADAKQEMEGLDKNSAAYRRALLALLAASQADPTLRATHFYAPEAQRALAEKNRDRDMIPRFDDFTGRSIGKSTFVGPRIPYLPR